jgi:hypothetical protein
MKNLRAVGSLGVAALLLAKVSVAHSEEPAIHHPPPVVQSSEAETRLPARYTVRSVPVASQRSEVEVAEPVKSSPDPIRIAVGRNAFDVLDEPMNWVIDPSPSRLTRLAPSSAFSREGSQDVPASDSSPVREGLGASRGAVGGFVGFSTAGAEGLENGFLIGGNAAFFFLERFGIEAGVHRRSTDLAQTPSNALSGGSLDSTIATGGVVIRFPVSARVVPYVAGGVAYFSNRFEIDPSLSGRLAALNFEVTEEVESALGFNIGGGADVLVARRFVLFGEVRYLGAASASDTRAELRDTISGTAAEVGGSQDLNALEIRVGVRFVFPRAQRKAGKP